MDDGENARDPSGVPPVATHKERIVLERRTDPETHDRRLYDFLTKFFNEEKNVNAVIDITNNTGKKTFRKGHLETMDFKEFRRYLHWNPDASLRGFSPSVPTQYDC